MAIVWILKKNEIDQKLGFFKVSEPAWVVGISSLLMIFGLWLSEVFLAIFVSLINNICHNWVFN